MVGKSAVAASFTCCRSVFFRETGGKYVKYTFE